MATDQSEPSATDEPHLLSLPSDVLERTAALLLAADVPSAVQLVTSSKSLRSQLNAVCTAAIGQKITLSSSSVANDGADRVSVADGGDAGSDSSTCRSRVLEVAPDSGDGFHVAVSGVLPDVGVSFWTVIIESDENMGCMQIGVCDPEAGIAWSLMPYNGRLMRSRCQPGEALTSLPRGSGAMPDGHDTQALVDAKGRPTNLHRCAAGARVTVLVDRDAGTLCFGWNGLPPRVVLRGFPPTCSLRPWVCVPGWCGGRLRVAPFYQHVPPACRDTVEVARWAAAGGVEVA